MPIDNANLEDQPLGFVLFEQGTSGLRHSGGYILDEYQQELRGRRGRRTYRQMSNYSIIAAFLNIVGLLCKQATVRFKPRDDSPLARQIAGYVDQCWWDQLENGGPGGFIDEALSAAVFGWAWLEKVYKVRGGMRQSNPMFRSKYDDRGIGWRKFALRSQESLHRWVYSNTNEVLGWEQMAYPDFKLRMLTRHKALHIRFKHHKENPEGVSLIRGCYEDWHHAQRMKFIEAVGTERDLAGYPVATIPMRYLKPNATAEDKAFARKYFDFVRKVRMDHNQGAVFPPEQDEKGNNTGFSFKLMSAGGRRPGDVDTIINRYDSRIAMTVIAEFLLLGQGKSGGSYALSSDKTDLFSLALDSILDTIVEEVTANAIPELVELNGWPAELSPKMEHGDVETPNLQELGAYLSATIGTGAIIRDEKLERHLRSVASLPEPEPEPVVPDESRAPAPPPPARPGEQLSLL